MKGCAKRCVRRNSRYDDVVYVDSTQDGVDADMLESGGPATDFELEHEARRLSERLAFLRHVGRMWEQAALAWAEAVTRIPEAQIDGSLQANMRKHFTEKELVDLTLAIIAINGWNRLNISFRIPAGFQF